MRLSLIALVATVAAGWTTSAWAQAMPDFQSSRAAPGASSPQVSPAAPAGPGGADDGATTDYVVAGWGDPGAWQFSMGPTRQPDLTVLRLIRHVPGGAFGLECRRKDGAMQMRFLLDGYHGVAGASTQARLTVGGGGGPLRLVVEGPPPDRQDSALLVAEPVAITDILYAATKEPSGAELRIELEGRSFGMQLPLDKSVTEVSARICDGWHKAAREPASP